MDGKGRNRELIERRNAQIVSRYYYWTEVQRLRFDDAVRQLSENEFFLSESRIIQILKNGPEMPEADRGTDPFFQKLGRMMLI